jgi:hypothetical protein
MRSGSSGECVGSNGALDQPAQALPGVFVDHRQDLLIPATRRLARLDAAGNIAAAPVEAEPSDV